MLDNVGLKDFPSDGFNDFEKGARFFGGEEMETCCTTDDGESSTVSD